MPSAIRGGLNFIRLATPTTDDVRLPEVLQHIWLCLQVQRLVLMVGPLQKVIAENGVMGSDRFAGLCRLWNSHAGAGARYRGAG